MARTKAPSPTEVETVESDLVVDEVVADEVMPDPAPAEVEAFCLMDSVFGLAGDVISLSEEDAKSGENHGMLDLHPDAIAANK